MLAKWQRDRAKAKRLQAAELRDLAPAISMDRDRELLARHAADLDRDAGRLDAEAHRIEQADHPLTTDGKS
jgi:hypothetical protein